MKTAGKKTNYTWVVILISVVAILIALFVVIKPFEKQGKKTQNIEQYKTEYVGDATKVTKIVSMQEYPKDYKYDYIKIQSDKEPYGLTVYLKTDQTKDAKTLLEKNAKKTFDLIGNLDEIQYVNSKNNKLITEYSKDYFIHS